MSHSSPHLPSPPEPENDKAPSCTPDSSAKLIARLSKSAEDYLEAIGTLCEKNGYAQVSDIAQLLNVKKPSVTVAIRQLSNLGLVEYRQYSPIRLTTEGQRYAQSVMKAHHILRQFLEQAAGLSPERADEAACHMEHVLSYEEIAEISKRINH